MSDKPKMDSLATIADSQLLSSMDCGELAHLGPELEQCFQTAQVFRTRTEALVSVLNDVKRPTPDAKYWQATREQDVMLTELTMLSFEYRKNRLELLGLMRRRQAENDELAQAMLDVEIDRLQYLAGQMRRTAHHRVREILMWSQIKAELAPELRYGTDDVDAHQLEAMRLRFEAEASLVSEHTPFADARNVLGLNVSAKRLAEALETD